MRDRNFAASKSMFKNSLALGKGDENQVNKSREALALLACAEGMALEKRLEADIDQARNTYLYGIVIVIIASFLLSLVLRYGPQKAKAIERVEDWVLQARRLNEKSASDQAGAMIFTVFIFALVAFGLMAVLMLFMWSLTMFSQPEDGHFKEADPYYNEAIQYLNAAGRGKEIKNKSDVVKYYERFFKPARKAGGDVRESQNTTGKEKESSLH